MARGPYKEALVEELIALGVDDREQFILLARAGMVEGQSPEYREIGARCEELFGYAITKQRAHAIVGQVQRRMGRDKWEALFGSVKTLAWQEELSVEEKEERKAEWMARRLESARRRRIHQMRTKIRSLPLSYLQYEKILRHFKVEIPERRELTAALMDGEQTIKALHEDFKIVEACGLRICTDCGEAKSLSEDFYKYNNRPGVVQWCKACNAIRWRMAEEKRKLSRAS